MGTIISQKIYGAQAKAASEAVLRKIKKLEAKLTINAPGGEINQLNNNAGLKIVTLSKETISLLKKATQISKLSEGAFDITVGPLVKLWKIGSNDFRIPSKQAIATALKLVSYQDLQITGQTARLAEQGQLVDLGGIAKGYAGEVATTIFQEYQIKSAFVNLGGNVVAVGSKPDGKAWRIGIQNPRGPKGSYIGIVAVKNKSVVTSGDYERFFEKNGQRYHHLLDPHTGVPAKTGLLSVTIVANSPTVADALSTAVFILGLEKGWQLVTNYPELSPEAIFITTDKKIYVTSGLKKTFIFQDESGQYHYVEKR